ncbi:MAG: c-type cytochrome [Acidocella sp.]|nr:c-type cytochrome [Acidocella sp.]
MLKYIQKAAIWTGLTAGFVLSAGQAWAAGNTAAGAQLFQSQCAMCHATTPGMAGIGPSLAGVYGEPAASTAGYDFSPALKSAHLVWNVATLNKFLKSPQSTVPGTKMPYSGLPSVGQRADLIAYLVSLKGK